MSRIDLDVLGMALREFEVEIETGSLDDLRLSVSASKAQALLHRLRDEPETSMQRLVDLTVIDRGGDAGRFEIVYCLHSPELNRRMRVHVGVDAADPTADSVRALWPAADWLEREAFDLFGIRFRGHPNLRRILLEPDFEGSPLRKDYPRQPQLALPKEAPR